MIKKKITKDIVIAELVEEYPELANFLMYEYDFHCVNCIIAGLETLEEGAKVHGIEGEEFEEMLKILNEMAENDE